MAHASRVAAVPILLIAAEVIFWSGAALGGAEVMKHRRRYGATFRRRIGPRLRALLGLKWRPKNLV
jgi:hypothetical protein